MLEIKVVALSVKYSDVSTVQEVRIPKGVYDESGTTIVTMSASELTVLTALVYSMKSQMPEEFMDLSDVKVSDKVGFLPASCQPSNEHDHEAANLDQSCRQQDCISAFVPRHWRSVARQQEPKCKLNSTSWMSQTKSGHPKKFLLT